MASKLEQLREMREKTSKKPKAKVAKAQAKAKTDKAKAPKAKKANGESERGAKSLAIAEMLKRSKGCTGKDVKAATGWQSVSMPAMAKQLGIKLRIEKVPGEPTRYFGA